LELGAPALGGPLDFAQPAQPIATPLTSANSVEQWLIMANSSNALKLGRQLLAGKKSKVVTGDPQKDDSR